MAMKIRPPKKADVTALLRNLFLRTEQELIREITRKRAAGHVEYAEVAALERVQKILQSMVDTSWSYVPAMIEKIFYHSDKDAAGYANARSMTGTYSVTQIALMEHLANNLQGELVEMAGTAKRSVESVFTIARLENDPYRKLTLEQILRQEAAGKPWIRTSEDLIKEMETNGITGFTDKAGRKWSMQAYGNMAVRTTARQAEVAALLSSDEYDLWQITKVGTTCPVCAPLEGRVYSKSGTNPDYPPLTVAFGKVDPAGADDLSNTYLNIHPNCLHALVKYTTIGKSAERIQKDKDFSSIEKNPLNRDPRTKKQIVAYREKERNRQKLLRDMKQHKEYRSILGNDVPKDFAKFRDLKYNDGKKWNILKKTKHTFSEIDRKNWTDEFKQKSKEAFIRFRKHDIVLSAHALGRLPRLNKPGLPEVSEDDLIRFVNGKPTHKEDDNKVVYFSGELQLAVIRSIDTWDIVSVVRRKSPKEVWRDV